MFPAILRIRQKSYTEAAQKNLVILVEAQQSIGLVVKVFLDGLFKLYHPSTPDSNILLISMFGSLVAVRPTLYNSQFKGWLFPHVNSMQ